LSGALDELFVSYDPVEDRILLRMKTLAGDEARAWLTRRLAPALWQALTGIVQSDPAVQSQASAQGREALIDFSREQALAGATFRTRYQDAPPERQMFPRPLLVSEVRLERPAGGMSCLVLQDPGGARLDMRVGAGLAHAWCKLLGDAVDASGWQLELPRPGAGGGAVRPN